MDINNTVFDYFNKEKKRELGRYRATDLYKMKKGDLTPENYFKNVKVDWDGISNMFPGMAYESMLNEIFRNHVNIWQQCKYEIDIADGIKLVFVTDYEMPDKIIEAKFPTRFRDEICEWHKDQCEIQYRGTKKDVYQLQFLGREDIKKYKKLCIIYKYKPSIVRWNNIQKTLINFHKDLILWQTKKKPLSRQGK
jgi:hypothetical protein